MVFLHQKKAVFVGSLLVIFSVTGVAYALAAKKTLDSKKVSVTDARVETQKEEIKRGEMSAETVATDNQSGAVADAAVDQSKQSDTTADSKVPASKTETNIYPLHKNISTTYFWVGEEAGADNKNISNLPSAWDEDWAKHFGGVDTPDKRSGFFPAKFTPKENPFYFALPYNDFDNNGNRKKEISSLVPWAGSTVWKENQSVLKNQWIKIMKGSAVAYAQWQDVGPFKEDDASYVFGSALPKSKVNNHAGLDVSPAVRDMLGLSDIDTADWQFIPANQVPDGPWKKVVTTSQVYWK